MNIESELKDLLRRREPPPGFAERVMARIAEPKRRGHGWRAIAAAAALVVVLGAWGVRVTLHARDELRLAMRITVEKVADAQQQVRAVSR